MSWNAQARLIGSLLGPRQVRGPGFFRPRPCNRKRGPAFCDNRQQPLAPRRFVALVLSASLLHLSSARADAVCIVHAGATGATPAAHHETAAPSDHHEHSADAAEDEACKTPALPECCQALAACSVTLGSQASLRVNEVHLLHVSVVAALQRAPLSRVATPDPPPPKL